MRAVVSSLRPPQDRRNHPTHAEGRAASPRRPVLVKEAIQSGGFGETALPYRGVEFE